MAKTRKNALKCPETGLFAGKNALAGMAGQETGQSAGGGQADVRKIRRGREKIPNRGKRFW